jgi:hypothetical protein
MFIFMFDPAGGQRPEWSEAALLGRLPPLDDSGYPDPEILPAWRSGPSPPLRGDGPFGMRWGY